MYRVILTDYQTEEEYKLMLNEEQIRLLTYLTNNQLDSNGFNITQCWKDDFEILN